MAVRGHGGRALAHLSVQPLVHSRNPALSSSVAQAAGRWVPAAPAASTSTWVRGRTSPRHRPRGDAGTGRAAHPLLPDALAPREGRGLHCHSAHRGDAPVSRAADTWRWEPCAGPGTVERGAGARGGSRGPGTVERARPLQAGAGIPGSQPPWHRCSPARTELSRAFLRGHPQEHCGVSVLVGGEPVPPEAGGGCAPRGPRRSWLPGTVQDRACSQPWLRSSPSAEGRQEWRRRPRGSWASHRSCLC